jgi:hypothetical protein
MKLYINMVTSSPYYARDEVTLEFQSGVEDVIDYINSVDYKIDKYKRKYRINKGTKEQIKYEIAQKLLLKGRIEDALEIGGGKKFDENDADDRVTRDFGKRFFRYHPPNQERCERFLNDVLGYSP